jgi:predicted nucleic acid-binding protein
MIAFRSGQFSYVRNLWGGGQKGQHDNGRVGQINRTGNMELEIATLLTERRDPKQGAMLRAWVENIVLPDFEGILVFDTIVAQRCARLHVPNPKSERDYLIAATALVHGMTVVTRNIADFRSTGVPAPVGPLARSDLL